MTQGKNPKNFRKKGMKKKLAHPFVRKEWYEVKTPIMFEKRSACLTPCTKSQGTKLASDSLKGRVFEVSLSDLMLDNTKDYSWRKMKLCCEEVKERNLLTNFHGMSMTKDKLAALVSKWHTLIEGHVDAKTSDGYILRLFCIGFTSRAKRQVKATSYATSSKIKAIRKIMHEVMMKHCNQNTLKDVVKEFIQNKLEETIKKQAAKIYPMQNILIRKVKMLKKPKFDSKLGELYGDQAEKAAALESGKKDEDEPVNLLEQEEKEMK